MSGSTATSQNAGASGSVWYQNEDLLLGVARQLQAVAAPPVIPGYEIHFEIKRDGQRAVYAARQHSTKREVAIKVLLAGSVASTAQRQRFEREAEVAASPRQPNIVRIYDSGVTSQGFAFLVLELPEGASPDTMGWIPARLVPR